MNLSKYFQKSDLIPVVAQDAGTRAVLMVAYANEQALQKTLETKTAWFWSRSRQCLWNKGATSGNYLHIQSIYADCDDDTLLYLVTPDGPACHTGATSCFFNQITEESLL